MKEARKWVDLWHEELEPEKIRRLIWVLEAEPEFEAGKLFSGGPRAIYLYNNVKLAYVYGLYTSCIMGSLAFIERVLLGRLYGAGFDEAKYKSGKKAIDMAFEERLISMELADLLHEVRRKRNPTTHFRPPDDDNALGFRGIRKNKDPHGVLKDDAMLSLFAMFRVAETCGVGRPISRATFPPEESSLFAYARNESNQRNNVNVSSSTQASLDYF